MANTDVAAPGAEEAALIDAFRNLGFALLLAHSAVAVPRTGATAEAVLATVTIPAGILGPNGIIRVTSEWSCTNNANNKIPRIRLGGLSGTAFFNPVLTTSTAFIDHGRLISNRNAENSQFCRGLGMTGGASGSALVTASIDTTVAQDLVFTAELANGADTLSLENYLVELLVP